MCVCRMGRVTSDVIRYEAESEDGGGWFERIRWSRIGRWGRKGKESVTQFLPLELTPLLTLLNDKFDLLILLFKILQLKSITSMKDAFYAQFSLLAQNSTTP